MTNAKTLAEVVRQIGEDVAGPNSADVDKDASFPQEALDALKKAKILSAGVPIELGGAGLNIMELGELVRILATYCASTSMILGMHYIKVSSLVHYGKGDEKLEGYLRSIADEQRLVASVTSEEGIGGNLRNSICAVEVSDDTFELTKVSTCLSYGAYADDLLITARKDTDSPASGQVVVLARRGDFTLEQTGEWDSMGMRGTCSPPFVVHVNGPTWLVLGPSFAEIAARTMVPDTHVIWSHVWLGIACDAYSKAKSLVQAKARKNPSELPETARELALLDIKMRQFFDSVNSTGNEYLQAHENDDAELLTSIGFSLRINALKLSASTISPEICLKAMEICGFAGYLNNTPYSVTRNLRDSLSAAPMIGNGRIIETNATNLMAHKGR
jgi:acyl-CoA dehydrogenase